MRFRRQEFSQRAARFASHPATRKITLWIVALIAVVGVLGGVVAPAILRAVLPGRLSEQLHREVTIRQIRINPYTLAATIYGFAVRERDRSATAISFDELRVDLELESLFRLGPVLKELQLVKPYVRLVRDQNGAYNFQDLIDEATSGPPSEPGPTPRFALNNIEILDGKIEFDDQPEQTKHEVSAIRLGVPFISSIPSFAEIKVEPAFSAVVNGAPIQVLGETLPFKESRESEFRFSLENFQLAKYLEYSPVKLNFTVPSGRLDGTISAAFKIGKDKSSALALSGDLGLTDLVMLEKGEAALLKLPSLEVAVESFEVFARRAAVKAVKAQGLELHLTRSRDGVWNLGALVESPTTKPAPPPTQDTKPFLYNIEQILLDSATLHFADESLESPYRTRLENVRLNVGGLSNEPEKQATVELTLESQAKEKVTHNGTLRLTPLQAQGQLAIEALRLGALQPYYQSALAGEFKQGFFDLTTHYAFETKDERSSVKLSELNAGLREVRLELAGQPEPLWRIESLAIKDGALDLTEKAVTIGLVEGRNGSGYLQREPDGTLSYARLVKKSESAPPPQAPPEPADAGWKIVAKRVVLDRFGFNYDDRAPGKPLKVSLSDLSLRADGVSNAKNQRAKATIRTRINNRGLVTLAGTVGANPVLANLDIQAQDIEIAPFQSTFTDQLNLAITEGRVGTRGKLVFDASGGGPAKVAYDGSVQVIDFASNEKQDGGELLKWKSLNLAGVQFALEPMRLRINEITLAEFYSRLILGADGRLNLQKLTTANDKSAGDAAAKPPEAAQPPAEAAEKPPEAAPPAPAEPPAERPITIGKINLQSGQVYFSDLFIKPNYSANLMSFEGSISELRPEAPGDIAITAKLDNYAPVEIRGKVNPLGKDLYLDITADAKQIEMSPFTPYSIKYVGYGIEKGTLSFNVKYKVENRKLEAQNQIILNQLVFGQKVESPTATSLPVLFAVGLLKDRNGVIDVNLPISGSLDDPQFSIGGIVLRLVINLITRAVTAPFTLIASVFSAGGGSGEELSFVEFDYGRATLAPAAEAKIKTLATAMNNRPALKLDINPRFDPANDLEGLKKLSLERKVKGQKLKDLARDGKAPKSVDDVQIAPGEYERYLKAAYGAETFPKPRNVVGLAKDLPVAEMEALILKHIEVGDDNLHELARRRGEAVRDRILSAGEIGSDRVFTVAPKAAEPEGKAKSSRVDFSLK